MRPLWYLFPPALAFSAVSLSAQEPSAPPRIAAITLQRQNIFDTSESSWWLTRFVNHLHKRTLEPVIRNELLFHVGDPVDTSKFAETARNLRRMRVFRDVQLDTVRSDSGIIVHVNTRDAWSTHPDFRFNSTGGSVAYTLAMIEDNLFGTATQAQLLYRKDPDRTATILAFQKSRLFFGKISTSMQYFDQSDGTIFAGAVSKPFFSLSDKFGGDIEWDVRSQRILTFLDGNPVAADTVQRRYFLARASFAGALSTPTGGYLRAGFIAQIRRDNFASQSVYDITSGSIGKNVTGAFGGVIEQRRGNFLKVRGYQSFGREEDIDLSRVIRASILLAPKALGYDRDGIAPAISMQAGAKLPGGFLLGEAWASGLFDNKGLDSGQVHFGVTAALLARQRHNLVVHAEVGRMLRPLPGAEYDLGLGIGPRAFTEHSFTGDREYFATAEYRYTIAPEIFKVVGIGVAAFADHGGAAWHGQPMRSGTDVGVGLRIGPSRDVSQEANRIDISRRFATDRQPAGWVLSIGKGFVFGSQ